MLFHPVVSWTHLAVYGPYAAPLTNGDCEVDAVEADQAEPRKRSHLRRVGPHLRRVGGVDGFVLQFEAALRWFWPSISSRGIRFYDGSKRYMNTT